jgi:hypothetical protein
MGAHPPANYGKDRHPVLFGFLEGVGTLRIRAIPALSALLHLEVGGSRLRGVAGGVHRL